ncbi:conserved hypothetical protein [Desulfosarcina cetonica]|uniref:hypothetical protein n=1 Tax=Desulfosarcina cetonica TaxID=90730 RepID=UPI0006D07DD8|nr:hypothetical protein [Desulfosarcina cetonica]VTR67918.1 conserved hypothetical protein [Desulfosarcina cetonica]
MIKRDCESFVEAGNSYLKTAQRGHRRESVFTGTMLYPILCLSIEKYLMGLFCYHNAIPQHNTLARMAREAADFVDIPMDLIEAIQSMDGLLDLCDPAAPLQMGLSDAQLQSMIAVGEKIRDLVSAHMPCAA